MHNLPLPGSLLLRSIIEDGTTVGIKARSIAPKTIGDRFRIWNEFVAEAENIGLTGATFSKGAFFSFKYSAGRDEDNRY